MPLTWNGYTTFVYLQAIILCSVTSDDQSKTSAIDAADSKLFLQDYLQKICNHSDTCHLIDKVPSNYRNLRTRNCMCDKQCARYGDCCRDSPFANSNQTKEEFACVRSSFDGYVYMKTSCPRSWSESTTKENCESRNISLLNGDVWLSTPVVNRDTRVTYRNLFCAHCHGEITYEFWLVGISCEGETNVPAPTTDDILSNLSLDKSNEWFFKANSSARKCTVQGKLPAEDDEFVRYCVPNVIDTCLPQWKELSANCSSYASYTYVDHKAFKNPACLQCNNVFLPTSCTWTMPSPIAILYNTTIDSKIPKLNHCSEVSEGSTAFQRLCAAPASKKPLTVAEECYPSINCLVNGLFLKDSDDIEFIDNETINLKSFNLQYPSSEFSMLPDNKTVFVCGSYVPRSKLDHFFDVLNDWVSEILIKLSIVFLLLHLLIFQQLPEMKNLSGKTLAMFCGTMLIAFLCFEIGPLLSRCEIVAMVQHYAFLSCFMWMLIMSYDCWLSMYRATKKFRQSGGKHVVRFLTYCILAWVVPGLVIGVSVYSEFAATDKVPCEWKPAYGKYGQCFIGQVKGLYVYFFLPATCMFLGNIGFFAYTAYMIYLSQRQTVNPNTRNDFQLYTRLALMMGLTWTLGSLVTIYTSVVLALLFSILNGSQGIFIFFAFTFKEKNFKLLLNKHPDNTFLSTTLSTFMSSNAPEPVPTAQPENHL